MPEHILPLPPRWERDLDCGWIEYKSGADDIRGYLAKPKRGGRLPGLVMLHENLGVIEHRQDVTRRLAKAGFVAITVDLYSRIGGISPRDFKTPQERRIKASLANPDEQGVPRRRGNLPVSASPWTTVDRDRIGAVGYCSGGGTLYSWLCGQLDQHQGRGLLLRYGRHRRAIPRRRQAARPRREGASAAVPHPDPSRRRRPRGRHLESRGAWSPR